MIAIKGGGSEGGGGGGHHAFDQARLIDAFSERTVRYNGQPSDVVFGMVRSGMLLALDISENELDESQQADLQSALASDECRIRSLVLNECEVGAAFAVALAEMVASGHLRLTVLGLRHSIEITEAVWIQIAAVVATNKTLTNLDLYSCRLPAAAGEAIAKALLTNKTLTNLNLSQNRFPRYCRCVDGSPTAMHSQNCIGEVQTEAAWIKIAAAVATNKTLTNLDVRYCNVSDEIEASLRSAWGKHQRTDGLLDGY